MLYKPPKIEYATKQSTHLRKAHWEAHKQHAAVSNTFLSILTNHRASHPCTERWETSEWLQAVSKYKWPKIENLRTSSHWLDAQFCNLCLLGLHRREGFFPNSQPSSRLYLKSKYCSTSTLECQHLSNKLSLSHNTITEVIWLGKSQTWQSYLSAKEAGYDVAFMAFFGAGASAAAFFAPFFAMFIEVAC